MRLILLNVFGLLLLSNFAFAQRSSSSITSEEIEAQVERELKAYADFDFQLVASKKYGLGSGYGFRAEAARSEFNNIPLSVIENTMKVFFDSLEYYNLDIEEIHTAVHGDTGIAWGAWVEDFRIKGQEPEIHRVRFSYAFRKNQAGELYAILGHRDIQDFDENGQYIP